MREMKGVLFCLVFVCLFADWEETRHAGLKRVAAGSEHVLLGFNGVKKPASSELFLGFGSGFAVSLIGNQISLLCCCTFQKKILKAFSFKENTYN